MTPFQNFLECPRPDDTNLLRRRMTILGLDVDAWLETAPAMLADLERSCSVCVSRSHCADDLMSDIEEQAWTGWRNYCPDEAGLRTLLTLQGFLKKGLTIDQAIERLGDHPQVAPIETD